MMAPLRRWPLLSETRALRFDASMSCHVLAAPGHFAELPLYAMDSICGGRNRVRMRLYEESGFVI